MSELTHWTIRVLAGFAATVAVAWLIASAIRYNIATNHEVQKACIEQGGSWIVGQCIQLDGSRS